MDRVTKTAKSYEALVAVATRQGERDGLLVNVQLDELLRMADFARVLARSRPRRRMGTLGAYNAASQDVSATVLDSDVLACAIGELMAGRAAGWTGTAAELLELLIPDVGPCGFPRSLRAVSGHLRRLEPSLRSAGVDVEFAKRNANTSSYSPHAGPDDARGQPSRPTSQPDQRKGPGRSAPDANERPAQPSSQPPFDLLPARPPFDPDLHG